MVMNRPFRFLAMAAAITCSMNALGHLQVLGAAELQETLQSAVTRTLAEFAKTNLASNQIAVTVVDLANRDQPVQASFRGDVPIYPASVIKLFYLVAAHRWMEDGKMQDTPELRRAMRDMIVDSGNDPTHYILDLLTGTTGGPELPESEMKIWLDKRNAVNRYFASLGFNNCNINQKPWGDGPYGRERISVGKNYENRNALTTDATARLLTEIVQGKAVSAKRCSQMMELLKRDPSKPRPVDSCDPDQSLDFSAIALHPGDKVWSKAGWTSTTRHDAAYIETSAGGAFVIVTFTTGHASDREIIPSVVRKILSGNRSG
jgi:beta-lactamase class A